MDLLNRLIFETWSALAQGLIFGITLTLAVRLALGILTPANASTRFAIWFATLVAVAALPPALLVRTAIPHVLEHAQVNRDSPSKVPLPVLTSVAAEPAAPSRPVATEAAVQAEQSTQRPMLATEADNAYQTQLFLPSEAAAGILCVYAVIVCLLLVRLGVSYLRLRRLKAHISPAPPEAVERFEKWLRLCRTWRPVRLALSAQARSPMAVGFSRPAVIIPDSLLFTMTGEELDHLGLHEVAHIRRRDDWTNLAQRVIQALFFFHPAVHWICGRLEFEREVACDDWVLTLTGAAKPYARSLAKILEHTPWRRGPVLASGAVFRKRQILRRVEMLLDGSRDARPRVSYITFLIILMCVIGALSEMIQMPALVAFMDDPGGSHQRSVWSTDGHRVELDIRGEVQFSDDDNSVRSISPGGSLRVSESGWRRRELEIRQGTSSRPEMRYLVNGREQPIDNQAREWAATTLAFVIRESGMNAEERALRILDKRGVGAVLEEIDRISSDHSRQRYLSTMIRSGKLETEDLRRAMTRVGRISSDHDKASLLLETANSYQSDELLSAYFDAVNSIHSDGDRRRVLTRIVEDMGNTAPVLARAARSVEQMSSDHDKAEVLRLPALRAGLDESAVRHSLMRAAASIHSDNDKAGVLSAILSSGPLPSETVTEILRVAAKIESDHDKAQVLELSSRQDMSEPSSQAGFFAAAGTIRSDNDRARVLSAAIDRGFSGAIPDELARAIEQIASDHEKANVLVKLSAQPATPALLNAVRSIHSDHDKRRVIEAMLERQNSAAAAKDGAALAATISSDHDKSHVLAAIAEKYRGNPEVREEVRKAAEKIASDGDYRRIVSKL